MSEKPNLVIIVRHGVVEDVLTDEFNAVDATFAGVYVVDYDDSNPENDDVMPVPPLGQAESAALAHVTPIAVSGEEGDEDWVMALMFLIDMWLDSDAEGGP